jgi:hypothetical protein
MGYVHPVVVLNKRHQLSILSFDAITELLLLRKYRLELLTLLVSLLFLLLQLINSSLLEQKDVLH